MGIASIGLSILAAFFAATSAYMFLVAGLGSPVMTYDAIILHIQLLDVIIAVGAAICGTICLATVSLLDRG